MCTAAANLLAICAGRGHAQHGTTANGGANGAAYRVGGGQGRSAINDTRGVNRACQQAPARRPDKLQWRRVGDAG